MTVRGYKMKMSYVNREGRKTRPSHWVDVPPSTRHARGLAEIEGYVARVIASKAKSSSAHFSTKSGNTAIGVAKYENKLSLGLVTSTTRERKREAAIRQFFAARNISPSADYLAANGGVPNATRVLDFPMPHDPAVVAQIAADLLRYIYRLRDSTTLDIRFRDHEAS
jgi:hypothetical protein